MSQGPFAQSNIDTLPPLVDGAHVVVVTAYYPPQVTGSSVIMQNLLSRFHPESFTVATAASPHRHQIERTSGGEVVEIVSSTSISYRLNEWMRAAQIPLARRRLEALIRRKQADLVLAVYPDLHFVQTALDAAKACGVPFVAYLHDTIAEGMEGKPLEERSKRVQERVFTESARLLVMSEGMSDLYRRKYGLDSVPIVHSYPEPIPTTPWDGPVERQALWGGSLFMVNITGVQRVSAALSRLETPFLFATNRSLEEMGKLGITGDHVRVTFFSQRSRYLEALRGQRVLVQALNWPEESGTHDDEMRTVFPTKTAEYLASGTPMLVHCPEHYFLARFMRAHGCGVVVSSLEPEAMDDALRSLLDDSDRREQLRRAALETAQYFAADRVATSLQTALGGVASSAPSVNFVAEAGDGSL